MPLRQVLLPISALIFIHVPGAWAADYSQEEMKIKSTLQERYPDVKILGIQPTPLPGLYEIYTGDSIAYTNDKGEYLIAGPLMETRSKRNLTAESLDAHNAIDFKSLPLDRAIKTVLGNGKRELAVFADPDCPYCRQLEKELATMTDVTIYTFLYPLSELHPDAEKMAHAVWCAPDRSAAWSQWMLDKKQPEGGKCDNDPVRELQALGKKLHISGTPTLFLASGRRVGGTMPASKLSQLLDEPTVVGAPH